MEKLTARKQAVLDVLDEQIDELERRLAKAQPLFDELNSLRATRARLLDERSTTSGAGRNGSRLSMETVIHDLRENGASSVPDIAKRVGVESSIVRSHLNRHKEVRYRQDEDGDWELIGEE
jgi:hypothetical protein